MASYDEAQVFTNVSSDESATVPSDVQQLNSDSKVDADIPSEKNDLPSSDSIVTVTPKKLCANSMQLIQGHYVTQHNVITSLNIELLSAFLSRVGNRYR
ncbi:hypothetical protein AVEN_257669-1 [Araneus ventricosus]|uniref:Uncharacterized protein n=1 Tax=Araneus ventricosus TaxID=182803 RepID=A0A4Y2LE76_ARAVE|nr:hypothetical protein AVEN_257669-1 [Araneus ventricosus]